MKSYIYSIQHLTILILCSLSLSCSESTSQEITGYAETDLIFISTPASGYITKVNASVGSTVEKNFHLASLDLSPEKERFAMQQAQYKEALHNLEDAKKGQRIHQISALEAKIKQASAELNLAKERLTRAKTLFKAGNINEDQLDVAKSNFQKAEGLLSEFNENLAEAKLGMREDNLKAREEVVNSRKAMLNESKWSLEQRNLYSPYDAIVYDVYYKIGEYVPAQKPILSLLAKEHYYFKFYVPYPLLQSITLNKRVFVRCLGCKEKIESVITYISSKAEFTPPLVYSENNSQNLSFQIRAKPVSGQNNIINIGQPVTLVLHNG